MGERRSETERQTEAVRQAEVELDAAIKLAEEAGGEEAATPARSPEAIVDSGDPALGA
jgi:hypothetical protein